eukprot:2462333-Prymnesium_polylepis.10
MTCVPAPMSSWCNAASVGAKSNRRSHPHGPSAWCRSTMAAAMEPFGLCTGAHPNTFSRRNVSNAVGTIVRRPEICSTPRLNRRPPLAIRHSVCETTSSASSTSSGSSWVRFVAIDAAWNETHIARACRFASSMPIWTS